MYADIVEDSEQLAQLLKDFAAIPGTMNAKSILPVRKIIRSVDLSKPSEK